MIRRLGERFDRPGSLGERVGQRMAGASLANQAASGPNPMTGQDRLDVYSVAKNRPATFHKIDRNTERVVQGPNGQRFIAPTPEAAAKQFESYALGNELGLGKQNFQINLRGDFEAPDRDIAQFRDMLSAEAQTAYQAQTRAFDRNLAGALSRRGQRFGSIDEFESFVNRVPGASQLIGEHARIRARNLLERMDKNLYDQLVTDERVQEANRDSFRSWAEQNGIEDPNFRDPQQRQMFLQDRSAPKYRRDPASGRVAEIEPPEPTAGEVLRDSRDAAMDQVEQLNQEFGEGRYVLGYQNGQYAPMETDTFQSQQQDQQVLRTIDEVNPQRTSLGMRPFVPMRNPKTGTLEAVEEPSPYDVMGNELWRRQTRQTQNEFLQRMRMYRRGTRPDGTKPDLKNETDQADWREETDAFKAEAEDYGINWADPMGNAQQDSAQQVQMTRQTADAIIATLADVPASQLTADDLHWLLQAQQFGGE